MGVPSILFNEFAEATKSNSQFADDTLSDIHLDTVIQQILKGREEYELEPLFTDKLADAEAIQYRLDIMQEVDELNLLPTLQTFSRNMRKIRQLGNDRQTSNDKEQRWKWRLDIAYYYCQAILELDRVLQTAMLQSNGLQNFARWLTNYVATASFQQLAEEATELRTSFDHIQYSLIVENGKMTVRPVELEKDYCKQLHDVFNDGIESDSVTQDYSFRLFSGTMLSGLETNIISIVKRFYPDLFRTLRSFDVKFDDVLHPHIVTFEREVQFYIACLEFFHLLKRQGLPYCYPTFTDRKEIRIRAGYDIALVSAALHDDNRLIVTNNLYLEEEERLCVITGPNQGGKTTFARWIGQLMALSAIGCPVPCEAAELYVFDQLFTHFPTREQVGKDMGQLKEELLRLKSILDEATGNSIVLLNELFSTTATLDAYAMGKKTLQLFSAKGVLCFYVTHIAEMSDALEQIVSFSATIDRAQPAKRTFKIMRKIADGDVYTSSLVDKYRLSRSHIEERIKS